ncbi:MAG: HAD-IC family P-type ATPase [bacterium]
MESITINIKEAKKITIDELLSKLHSSSQGLSSSEVKKRLQEYGYNEIKEKKKNPLLKFLTYFWGPIPWMIEIAAILSLIIQHEDEFVIIFILLLLNAIVGFWQEYKAGNAIELLRKRLALTGRVKRDGNWIQIPARELVPGDIIRVRLGEIIPADIKLIQGDYLLVDESALTGESLPVEKQVADVGYSGSIVRQGEMDALTVTTGMDTFFGKTTSLIEETKTESHFQKAVIKIGDSLIAVAITLVVLIFIVAIFRHESILLTLQFALILTVASIPAALPAILSITMAVGATALAKKDTIVSKLTAIEELAGIDILCVDKTGTITKNEISIVDVKPLEKFKDNDVLLYGYLSSRGEDKDPIQLMMQLSLRPKESQR